MRIAISNIAWRAEEEPAVRDVLAARGIDAVEVAPSKIGPRPAELDRDELARYRDAWNERGIEIVAMQALLFGRPELQVFAGERERRELGDYLARIVRLGAALGARALVFGSPKNRIKGALDDARASALAVPFFRDLGALAGDLGTCLCIEPNPPEYGADWIHSLADARAFVAAVDRPGFGVHVDAAALILAGEDARAIADCGASIRHFHASQVQLAPVVRGSNVPHETYASALREQGYGNAVSIEMRQVEATASNLPHVERALDYVQRVYGP